MPAALGLTLGSSIEWLQEGGNIVVKLAARSSTNDIHEALFDNDDFAEPVKTLAELKQGIAQHMQRCHARG